MAISAGNFIDMIYNIQRLFEIKCCTSASSLCWWCWYWVEVYIL